MVEEKKKSNEPVDPVERIREQQDPKTRCTGNCDLCGGSLILRRREEEALKELKYHFQQGLVNIIKEVSSVLDTATLPEVTDDDDDFFSEFFVKFPRYYERIAARIAQLGTLYTIALQELFGGGDVKCVKKARESFETVYKKTADSIPDEYKNFIIDCFDETKTLSKVQKEFHKPAEQGYDNVFQALTELLGGGRRKP